MNKKWVITLLSVCLVLALALTGCGGDVAKEKSGGSNNKNIEGSQNNTTEEKQQKIIKFLNISQYVDTPEYDAFLKRFEERYPNIKVETISIPHDQYISKRNIMLASGETVDLIWGNGIYQFDAQNKGFLMPIEDVAKEAGIDMTTDFGSSYEPVEDGHYYRFPIQQNNWLLR